MENGKTFHPNKRNQGNIRNNDYPAFRSRLEDLIMEEGSINKFASKIGVTPRLIQKWRNGTFDQKKGCDTYTMPNASTLIRMAAVYGCSVDYVLGLTDCTTIENHAIAKETGLTDRSIRYLRKHKDKKIVDTLNFLLQDSFTGKDYPDLLTLISLYMNFNEEQIDKTYFIGEDDKDIVVSLADGGVLQAVTAKLSKLRVFYKLMAHKK